MWGTSLKKQKPLPWNTCWKGSQIQTFEKHNHYFNCFSNWTENQSGKILNDIAEEVGSKPGVLHPQILGGVDNSVNCLSKRIGEDRQRVSRMSDILPVWPSSIKRSCRSLFGQSRSHAWHLRTLCFAPEWLNLFYQNCSIWKIASTSGLVVTYFRPSGSSERQSLRPGDNR